MLPNIQINKADGGIRRALPSQDQVAGFIFYRDIPVGFTDIGDGNFYKVFYSTQEAAAAGLVGDFSDSVQAIGTITVTEAFTLNSIFITISSPVSFVYTVGGNGFSGSTTLTAELIKNTINTRFNQTGIRAIVSGAVVTLYAPAANINRPATSYNGMTITITGSGAAKTTKTDFSGGQNSKYTDINYHISEFFRVGGSELHVLMRTSPTSNFLEVKQLQNFTEGKIKQMAVYNALNPFVETDVIEIQAQINELEEEKQYLHVFYSADYSDYTLDSLPNLTLLNAPNVSVVLGQDGNNVGNKLATLLGYSITCIGAVLGVTARAKVSESIAWRGALRAIPFATSELNVAALALFDNILCKKIPSTQIQNISSNGYIILINVPGAAGALIAESNNCTIQSSDFWSIERNRTINKARSLTNLALLDYVSSPLQVNAAGQLTDSTINLFKSLIKTQLEAMKANKELSDYLVAIDPTQDVISTSRLEIVIKLIPVGVARFIDVTVSFTTSI